MGTPYSPLPAAKRARERDAHRGWRTGPPRCRRDPRAGPASACPSRCPGRARARRSRGRARRRGRTRSGRRRPRSPPRSSASGRRLRRRPAWRTRTCSSPALARPGEDVEVAPPAIPRPGALARRAARGSVTWRTCARASRAAGEAPSDAHLVRARHGPRPRTGATPSSRTAAIHEKCTWRHGEALRSPRARGAPARCGARPARAANQPGDGGADSRGSRVRLPGPAVHRIGRSYRAGGRRLRAGGRPRGARSCPARRSSARRRA